MENRFQCKECGKTCIEDEDADEHGTGLCCYCFEGELEDYEDNKRRRIAEQNEY
jgi:hypothetical protein